MRDYGKIYSSFWTGETGKFLRGHKEAQIVASYLLSNKNANMIGLYYLPILYLCYETGLTEKEAMKGLLRCIEGGYCSYDEQPEVVFVHEMALFQIDEQLKSTDKRCIGVQNCYDVVPACLFLEVFYEKYKNVFFMSKKRENRRGLEGALMPPRSQEQEQAQEQEQDQIPIAPRFEIGLTLNDKTTHHPTLVEIDSWQKLYPAVNIEQALRNMAGWCESHPKDRKTKSGINKFIHNWLKKDQDRGGNNHVTTSRSNYERPQTAAEKGAAWLASQRDESLCDGEA